MPHLRKAALLIASDAQLRASLSSHGQLLLWPIKCFYLHQKTAFLIVQMAASEEAGQ